MRIVATVVDVDALLKTVIASFVAGVGVTLIFSIAIFGVARFAELSRDERPGAAAAAATLAAVALLAVGGAVAFGIILMARK